MDALANGISWIWTSDYFGFNPGSYSIAIDLFLRLLGAIYISAYLPFIFQIRGLIGKDGIRPIADYLHILRVRLGKRCYYYAPTLLWINASDTALYLLVASGITLGLLLLLGVCPPLILLLLYITHLSLTSAGQEFMQFGWETFLMEITIAAMLLTATAPMNIFGWIALNFLILRFHIQAGASKILSRDSTWRDFTAIGYHYETQPLPNTTAWYFHKLPMWFHKFSVLIMYFSELIAPIFIFSPPVVRLIVFVFLAGLQWSIWLTGNLSYLNHLTFVCCLVLIHNQFLGIVFTEPAHQAASPIAWQAIVSLAGFAFLSLQVITLLAMFFPLAIFRRILLWVEPFHLAYPHGIFAVMTTKRYEIVVEGSDNGFEWQEYHFRYKPGNLSHRPRRISPYQPRLDWQAWFLPFGSFERQWWFQQFLVRLLQGKSSVTKLLKYNPFVKKPPRYVRALIYDYHFTTREEKSRTGNWWKRDLIGIYAPTMQLKKPMGEEDSSDSEHA